MFFTVMRIFYHYFALGNSFRFLIHGDLFLNNFWEMAFEASFEVLRVYIQPKKVVK